MKCLCGKPATIFLCDECDRKAQYSAWVNAQGYAERERARKLRRDQGRRRRLRKKERARQREIPLQ